MSKMTQTKQTEKQNQSKTTKPHKIPSCSSRCSLPAVLSTKDATLTDTHWQGGLLPLDVGKLWPSNYSLKKKWKNKYCKWCRSAEFKRVPQVLLTSSAAGSFLSWKGFHQNPSYRQQIKEQHRLLVNKRIKNKEETISLPPVTDFINCRLGGKIVKNRLLKTKQKHLSERACMFQTETPVCWCIHIICYQFLLFSLNFILTWPPKVQKNC